MEQSTCLPPSHAIYRIIQNQTKNSSFSNLLRIIYSGHCALNNVKRFRIRLVFSYRCSKKTVVLYCIVSAFIFNYQTNIFFINCNYKNSTTRSLANSSLEEYFIYIYFYIFVYLYIHSFILVDEHKASMFNTTYIYI